MRTNALFWLLLIVISVAAIPSMKVYPVVKHVNQVSGHVSTGAHDEDGRQHGRYTLHDEAGNLLVVAEYDHGECTYLIRYDSDGKLLHELREDENYRLVQTYSRQ
ncbi:toxin-antitoxin system YwqK family antitoxin [Gimesia algae]|uniref:RHS Repeat protein n=1 Tax=Gimesia algae TaxID=2527971 RepID=A0A517VAI1_9PLAN|nr:hypothetical protein [Gimesia algae]QDT89989.1 hypothetical protein Pan161_16220 [Gimesia algae]